MPTDLVLRVGYTGGFVTPAMLASRLPLVSVYADGTVISEGPQIAIWPAPALPNLQVRQISTSGVDRLVQLAVEAGVGRDLDLGEPLIADATSTRFVVETESGTEVLEVYALGFAPPGGEPAASDSAGLSAEQQAARAELTGLVDALTDLEQTLGAEDATPAEPYEPDAVAAVVTSWMEPGEKGVKLEQMPWPGPPLPGDPLMESLDVYCVTATGQQAEEVLAAAESATALTPWVSDGRRWNVSLRPLLPDESGCADLL